MQPVDTVLLAGGSGVRLRKAAADTPKPLIEIGGKSMLEGITRTLKSSGLIGRVILSIEPSIVPDDLRESYYRITSPGSEINDSIENGINTLGNPPSALLVTADIPFLTVEGLEHFLLACDRLKPELAMPAVTKECSEAEFPGGKRHYAHLPEGTFTLGNLCWITPSKLTADAYALISLAAGRRKSVFRLAKLLGLRTFIHFLTKKLTISEVEESVSYRLKMKTRVIFSPFAGVAFDIDSPEHYEYIQQRFATR